MIWVQFLTLPRLFLGKSINLSLPLFPTEVGQSPTTVRKGLKSSPRYNQPQTSAPVKLVKPGDEWVIKREVAIWRSRIASQSSLVPGSRGCWQGEIAQALSTQALSGWRRASIFLFDFPKAEDSAFCGLWKHADFGLVYFNFPLQKSRCIEQQFPGLWDSSSTHPPQGGARVLLPTTYILWYLI